MFLFYFAVCNELNFWSICRGFINYTRKRQLIYSILTNGVNIVTGHHHNVDDDMKLFYLSTVNN